MITFIPTPIFTAMDADGTPRVGAKLYTFATGTTTPKTTYTDSGKGTANTNPIILDANGQAAVWIDADDGAYRFRLDTPADVVLWTHDGIQASDSELSTVLTTIGDIVYASAANTGSRLAKGTARQVLQMNAGVTAPEWAASPQSMMSGIGDVLYASAANTLARLGVGTARQGLQINAGATAPEWADSPQSILTAKGDLLKASAANALARIALGAANLQLFVDAAGTDIEWASGSAIGTFQRDTAAASGAQAVTGVGFLPSVLLFVAGMGGAIPQGAEVSIGFDDGTNCGCLYNAHNSTNYQWDIHYGTTQSILLLQGAAISYYGKVTALGADGFTFTWVKNGASTGTADIIFLALR